MVPVLPARPLPASGAHLPGLRGATHYHPHRRQRLPALGPQPSTLQALPGAAHAIHANRHASKSPTDAVWIKQDSGLYAGKQGHIPDRLWAHEFPVKSEAL